LKFLEKLAAGERGGRRKEEVVVDAGRV